ncbi:MAG: Ca2+-dependent phosphoinositide-specific phospholipase C [Bacteroidetes bacterium]|nr:Ca2+-dependent phosphoinositide-specific phospholipase C [Bacteroidota bacterium]
MLTIIFCLFAFTVNAQDGNKFHLNQIQTIGSHNSYKKKPDEKVFSFLLKFKKRLGNDLNPEGIDYGHLPFDSQFNYYPVRGLEIDIYNDPKGGSFYKRRINAFVHGVKQKSGIEELKKPGFKVLHIKDVDYQTNYYSFKQALTAVKKWSDEHPKHLPLFINVETKGDGPGDVSGLLRFFGFKRSIKFDAAACDSIDAEIKSVFGNDLKSILTPDKIRGNYSSLNEMAIHNDWPLLDSCRGKIIFIMEGDAEKTYPVGHPSLQGRAMFYYAEPGKPECAFVIRNGAKSEKQEIKELVKKGYIVRTRADGDTREARENDSTSRDAAFESGAQIISTDYYKPELRWSNYRVSFPAGKIVRSNPVNAPIGVKEFEIKE